MRPLVPQESHKGSHISRKSGVYRYRRRLPVEGGREVTVSLRTRNYREAEHRAELIDGVFHGALARARLAVSQRGADLNAVLRVYLREVLTADEEQRLAAKPGRPVFTTVTADPEATATDLDLECLDHLLGDAREALAERETGTVAAVVSDLMLRHGLPEEVRPRLALGVLEAHVRYYEVASERSRGRAPIVLPLDAAEVQQPPCPTASTLSKGPAPLPSAKPLVSALVEPYFADRETVHRATHQVMAQDRGTLRRFLEACGDRPVDAYGRGDITGFLTMLRRLPNTYGRPPKDKARSLAEIIAEADASGAERLTDKTVKRHLSALSQFFNYALDQGHLTAAARTELTEGHRFRSERGARKQRDAWTTDELQALFASPVWTGCHPFFRSEAGPEIVRDARFWLPILALFHGGRLEEFADLYRRDIGCEDGVWFVRLTETEDRRLKTRNAERMVPLHSEVIRLGFLDYVQTTASKPDSPLFPDLEPQGKDGKRGPRFTRWFVEYRKAIGLYREGVGMHAFRHTAITRLTDAITTEQHRRHRDRMMGHGGGGGSEGDLRYDKGPGLKDTAETLALLRYPEVDLSHLHTCGPAALPPPPARSLPEAALHSAR